MNKTNKTICVLIADDHHFTRKGIRTILEESSDIKVVGEAKAGIEAKQMVAQLRPDILLLDLVMLGLRPSKIGSVRGYSFRSRTQAARIGGEDCTQIVFQDDDKLPEMW